MICHEWGPRHSASVSASPTSYSSIRGFTGPCNREWFEMYIDSGLDKNSCRERTGVDVVVCLCTISPLDVQYTKVHSCVVVSWHVAALVSADGSCVDGGVSLLHSRKRSLPLKLAPQMQIKTTQEEDKGQKGSCANSKRHFWNHHIERR